MSTKYFSLLPYYHLEVTSENICFYDLLDNLMFSIDKNLRTAAEMISKKRLINKNYLSEVELAFFKDLVDSKMGYWKAAILDHTSFYSSYVDTKYSSLLKKISLDTCELLFTSENPVNHKLVEKIFSSLSKLNCTNLKICFSYFDKDRIDRSLKSILQLAFKDNKEFNLSVQVPYFYQIEDLIEKYPFFHFFCVVRSKNEEKIVKDIVPKNSIFYNIDTECSIDFVESIVKNKVSSNNLIIHGELNSEIKDQLSKYLKIDNSYLYGLKVDEMAFNENYSYHQFGRICISETGNVCLEDGIIIGDINNHSLLEVLSSSKEYIEHIHYGKKNNEMCRKCAYRLGCLMKKENILFLETLEEKHGTLCNKE